MLMLATCVELLSANRSAIQFCLDPFVLMVGYLVHVLTMKTLAYQHTCTSRLPQHLILTQI